MLINWWVLLIILLCNFGFGKGLFLVRIGRIVLWVWWLFIGEVLGSSSVCSIWSWIVLVCKFLFISKS